MVHREALARRTAYAGRALIDRTLSPSKRLGTGPFARLRPMRFLSLLLAYVIFCAGCATTSSGPDYAREKRWADEVTPGLVVGEAVTLRSGEKPGFLGLYTPAARNNKGAVILVHGMGVHPDFGAIGELRALLADRGYATLSIQMPVLASDAPAEGYPELFTEAGERIDAALAWIRAKEKGRLAIVSHSMGARMTLAWIQRRPNAPIGAWVALSISTGEIDDLPRIRFPVFDVYAEKDFPQVIARAHDRSLVLRGIPGSSQAMIYGTDHYFGGREKELAALLDQLLARELR